MTSLASRKIAEVVEGVLSGRLTRVDQIPEAVSAAMQAASGMKHLKGIEKRDAVVKGLQLGIDRSDVGGPLEGVILALVPELCNLLVDVEDGNVVINKKVKGCFSGCFPKK